MSRTIDVRGSNLEEALASALAELLGCRPDDVAVRLEAPGLTELRGDLHLHLGLGLPDDDEGVDEARAATEDEPAAASSEPSHEPDDEERPDDNGGAEASDDDEEAVVEPLSVEDLDEEADAAADFLEGLLDALDLPGDLRIRVHEDHAEVEMLEIGSGALIGRRGQTLEAIQELVRSALQRQFQRRSRVKVDAEGYRARRLEKLLEKAEEAIQQVEETGQSERLEPMDVFERKAVHHLVADHEGVVSRSQGREPARRVVIEPAD